MSDEPRRDYYADGWAAGIQGARKIVLGARSREDALIALERLLVEDSRYRNKRAKANRLRKGLET